MSTATEVAVIDKTEFACLDPQALQAFKENSDPGESLSEADFIRVKKPKDIAKWIVPLDTGEENPEEIEGILVCVARQGQLWATDDAIGGDPPVLISRDLVTARNEYNVEIPEDLAKGIASAQIGEDELGPIYSWAKLPYTQWGSGKGKSKRAKDNRILFILPRDEVLPFIVTATPGSLKNVNPFIRRLPVPHYRAVVSLSLRLEDGPSGKYTQVVPRYVAAIDEAAGEIIKREYTDPLRGIAATMAVKQEED